MPSERGRPTPDPSPVAAYAVARRDNPLSAYWTSPAGLGGMSPPQRAFHEDPERKRFWLKGNKMGGSYALAAEGTGWSAGNHPYKPLPTPNTGLVVVPDLEQSYADDLCKCFHELIGPWDLHSSCHYSVGGGYKVGGRRGLLFNTGSVILFRSSWQAPRALKGLKVDWLGINEDPVRHLWGEILRSTFLSGGPIIMQFTSGQDPERPSQDLTWLRTEIEDPKKLWSFHQSALTYESVPHRTKSSVDTQMRDCPQGEYAQRILAKWDAPAIDRTFVSYSDAPWPEGCVVREADLPSVLPRQVGIGLGLDHGELPGNEAGPLYAFWEADGLPHALILDEYVSSGRTTVTADVIAIARILERHQLTYYAIDEGWGDHNSAGKTTLTTVNREFETQIALYLLIGRCPFRMRPAKKGAGSVGWGARVLDGALSAGRLLVHERCTHHRRAFSSWAGKDDHHKHLLDGVRYALAGRLDVSREAYRRIGVG